MIVSLLVILEVEDDNLPNDEGSAPPASAQVVAAAFTSALDELDLDGIDVSQVRLLAPHQLRALR